MDASDLVFVILTRGPFVLPLFYVLTILLRVACHFAGAEIPAMGRAFFTTSLITTLSSLAAMLLASQFNRFDASAGGLASIAVVFTLSLIAHALLALGFYRLLLGLPFRRAMTIWLIQSLSFAAFALAAGCLIGVPWVLFFQ